MENPDQTSFGGNIGNMGTPGGYGMGSSAQAPWLFGNPSSYQVYSGYQGHQGSQTYQGVGQRLAQQVPGAAAARLPA